MIVWWVTFRVTEWPVWARVVLCNLKSAYLKLFVKAWRESRSPRRPLAGELFKRSVWHCLSPIKGINQRSNRSQVWVNIMGRYLLQSSTILYYLGPESRPKYVNLPKKIFGFLSAKTQFEVLEPYLCWEVVYRVRHVSPPRHLYRTYGRCTLSSAGKCRSSDPGGPPGTSLK